MIHESGIEYCVVAEYADGYSYCMAKFMYEEDARNYKKSRRRKDYVEWKLYRRVERRSGEIIWEEL